MPAPKKRWTAFAVAVAVLIATPLAVVASDVFTDVPDSNVFHDDITWLADAGVTLGCNPPDNTEFCPSDEVTREQMAAFMHRLADNQVVDAATAVEAENADMLGGLAPTAYQTVIQSDGCAFSTCTDGPGGDIITNATVAVETPVDGVLHVSVNSTIAGDGAGVDFVQLWAAIDQTTNGGCGNWVFAPANAVPGSYAATSVDNTGSQQQNLASSTAVELPAGSHTVQLCIMSLSSIPVEAAALTTIWTQTGSALELTSSAPSPDELAELQGIFEGADLSSIEG